MRFLHTADLHLGRQLHGVGLEADQDAILDQIIAAARDHDVDALLIAGDVFDRANPSGDAVRRLNRFLRRLGAETRAALVMSSGNHDGPDRIEAMAAFPDPARALIRGVIAAEEPPMILQDAHGPVAISALPFAYEHAARAAFPDAAITGPEDVLTAQLSAARAAVPAGARWVVLAHGFVEGGAVGETERPLVQVGGVETVRAAIFDGADYVALGHLHRAQQVGAPHIRYSGAPLAYGFDEAGQEKSLTLVDMGAEGAVTTQLIPLTPLRAVRRLSGTLAELLSLPPSEDLVEAVLEDPAPPMDPMRRLRAAFPNACRLSMARDRIAPETKAAPAPERPADPLDLAAAFLEHLTGETAEAEDLAILGAVMTALRDEEAAA